MTFTTEFPTMIGSPSLTALTLAAGEAALTIGTKVVGALAQVSGAAAGFNIFTPTANATYYLIIRGQDVATGAASNAFTDVVEVNAVSGWTHNVITSTTNVGTPGARTYSNNTGAFKIAVATGTTWYIDVAVIRFPA